VGRAAQAWSTSLRREAAQQQPPTAASLPEDFEAELPGDDVIARATNQVKRRLQRRGAGSDLRAADPAPGPAPAPAPAGAAQVPLVTKSNCDAAAQKLGAMSCGLVTQVTGTPDGCECRLAASECPAADPSLGFTGVSPSMAVTLPEAQGETVILCMYWQWLPQPDRSQAEAADLAEARALAQEYVEAAHGYAEEQGKLAADALWTPPPATLTSTAAPVYDIKSFTRPPPVILPPIYLRPIVLPTKVQLTKEEYARLHPHLFAPAPGPVAFPAAAPGPASAAPAPAAAALAPAR